MKRFVISVLAFLLVVGIWSAGFSQSPAQGLAKSSSEKSLLGLDSSSRSFSLLDPNRVKMWHSYSLSYFSGKGGSGNLGLYMNTIEYRPSDPLRLQVSLGYLHQPFSVIGGQSSEGRVLPSFQLWYNPNSKIYLHINISTMPLWYDQRVYNGYPNRRR